MKFFFSYLWQRRGVIGVCLLLCLLQGLCVGLYRLPVGVFVYPAVLCLGVGTVLLAVDFSRVRQRYRLLSELLQTPSELIGELPDVGSVTDGAYNALVEKLCGEKRESDLAAAGKYRDMMEYFTIWAHQIKTPLAAMRLNLQSQDSEQARNLLNDLGRVEQYADMVMAFLRLESPSTDYCFRSCDLDGIVRGAVKKFAGEFIARRLKLELQPTHLQVTTDEKWLSFVVEQVLSNALKYTPTGGISIFSEGDDTLCIRDTGIGIAPEDLPRTFENGFTGFNGRADLRASGIGLFLCKRICDGLGHRILVESMLGVGTTVRIKLMQQELQVE